MDLKTKIAEFNKVNSRVFKRSFTKKHMAFLTAQLHSEASELYNESRSYLGRELSPEKTSTREKLIDEYGDTLGVLLAMGRVMKITPEEALDTVTKKLLQLELTRNANITTDNS